MGILFGSGILSFEDVNEVLGRAFRSLFYVSNQ